jgi:hypothetical protein
MKPIKETKRVRRYKAGYEVRDELMNGKEFGCPDFVVRAAYTIPAGHYIGDPGMARFLCKKMGIKPILNGNANVCSIGFQAEEEKWYGWSHRCICGFGIGDRIFEEDYGDEDTPFVEHGSEVIKTLEQAKKAAQRFAEYVS